MLDYDFDISNGKAWKRTGYGGIPDCTISLEALWPEIQQKFIDEFHWQRLLRLTRYTGCNDLERKLDWTVSKTLQKMTSDKVATGIMDKKANARFVELNSPSSTSCGNAASGKEEFSHFQPNGMNAFRPTQNRNFGTEA